MKNNKYLISPKSKWRNYFDFYIALLLFYTSTFFVYSVCFYPTLSKQQQNFDIFVDISFFVDIIVNFLSVTQDSHGIYEFNRKKLALNYIKSWFFLDILTIFPWNLFHPRDSGEENRDQLIKAQEFYRVIRVFKILKLLRLVKLSKLKRNLRKEEDSFIGKILKNSGIINLIITFLMYILFNHLMACLWYV